MTDVSFSPDGSQMLVMSDDGAATLLGSRFLGGDETRRLDSGLANRQGEALLERFSRNRRLFLTTLSNEKTALVDLEDLSERDFPPLAEGYRTYQARLDSTGSQWAVGYARRADDGPDVVLLWRGKDGPPRRIEMPPGTGVMRFAPDDQRLLTVHFDGNIRIWRCSDGTLARTISIPEGVDPRSVVLFPDGATALFVDRVRHGFWLLDLRDGTVTRTEIPPANLMCRAFDSTCDRFAVFTAAGRAGVWSTRTGQALTPLTRHGGSLNWGDWSPDDQRILMVGASPEVNVFDASTGELALPPFRLGNEPLMSAMWSLDGRFIVARSDQNSVRVWDAASGEPVTPILRHEGFVLMAQLAANNRLFTISLPNLMEAWDLKECSLPSELLTDYANLLSGRYLNAAGAMLDLQPDKLRSLQVRLNSSRPDLFTTKPEGTREWHRRLVTNPSTRAAIDSGLYHLGCLEELEPGDPWVRAQLARFRSCQIPPRDPDAPATLLDLSHFYTHSLDGAVREEFLGLPRGVQVLDGTPFDIRGVLRLESLTATTHKWAYYDFDLSPLPAARHIPVGFRCSKLHFLQAKEGAKVADHGEIARWIIHYADGTTYDWPVIYGEQLRDWWEGNNQDEPAEASQAVIAWKGHSPCVVQGGGTNIRLFKSTWTNPRPEIEISSLDFVLSMATPSVHPLVVAITAE